MAKNKEKIITSIGGQALMEGIMMRGPQKTVMAVRTPQGDIQKEEINIKTLTSKYKICRLPLIRGIAAFIDSMIIGYKSLSASAEIAFTEEELEESQSKFEKWIDDHFGDKILNIIMVISTILGILLAVFLFIVLPTYLFNALASAYPKLYDSMMVRSVFEGCLRILLFLIYIVLCSQIREMKRVFQYHGAEHKTIFCYENREDLTVENVKKQSRFHPRCGTSFIILMLLIGIIVGFFIPAINPILRSIIKILCFPVVVSIGYEVIKLCSKHENIITKIIAAPGLWMQRITTKEPEDDMIAVAIEALKEVIPDNGEDILS